MARIILEIPNNVLSNIYFMAKCKKLNQFFLFCLNFSFHPLNFSLSSIITTLLCSLYCFYPLNSSYKEFSISSIDCLQLQTRDTQVRNQKSSI